jgi:hypothetical protein
MARRPAAFNSPLNDDPVEDEDFYEAFDHTSDFKDGQFGEDGEFYFKEKRDSRRGQDGMDRETRRQLNKDRAIYGDLLDVSCYKVMTDVKTSTYWDRRGTQPGLGAKTDKPEA